MIVWVSDCGKYYAIPYKGEGGSSGYDVFSIDGQCYWLGNRYFPKGFNDTDKKYLYPEFEHMVNSWNLESRRTHRNGDFEVKAFSLGFSDLNKSIKIIPFTGNAVLTSYRAKFSKRKAIRKSSLVSPKELQILAPH